ncbi:hypothetical protein ACK32R_03685 [Aeromonas dhakensis]|uniref:hypothetical protein n=1 Tax=Aeromonas dhakensis TaxID=196024 RepID=UPI0039881F21
MVFLNTIFKHQDIEPSVVSWFLSNIDESSTLLSTHDIYTMALDEDGLRSQATMRSLLLLAKYFKRNPIAINEYKSVVGDIIEHQEFSKEIGNRLVYDFFNLTPLHGSLSDAINETIIELGESNSIYSHIPMLIESDALSLNTLSCLFDCFHKNNIKHNCPDEEGGQWLNLYDVLAKCRNSTLPMIQIGYAHCENKEDFLINLIKSHPEPSFWRPFVCDNDSKELDMGKIKPEILSIILLHGNLTKSEQASIFDFIAKSDRITRDILSFVALKTKHNQNFSFLNDKEFFLFTKSMTVYYPDASNALIESPRFPTKLISAIHKIGHKMPIEKRLFIKNYAPQAHDEFIHVNSLNETLADMQATYISSHKHALAESDSDAYSHAEDLSTLLYRVSVSSKCMEYILDELKTVFLNNKNLRRELCKQRNNTPRTLELLFSKTSEVPYRAILVSNPSFSYEYLSSLLKEDSTAHKLMFPSIRPHNAGIFEYVRKLSVEQYKELLALSLSGAGEFYHCAQKAICAHILNIHSYPRSLSEEPYDKELTLEVLHHAAKLGCVTKEDWIPLKRTVSMDDLDCMILDKKLSSSLPVEFMEHALSTHLINQTERVTQSSDITSAPARRFL